MPPPTAPAAEYAAASADGRRPGIVFLNASDLQARPTYTSEVLAVHEGIPGHHLQVATTMENRIAAAFRRFGDGNRLHRGVGPLCRDTGA